VTCTIFGRRQIILRTMKIKHDTVYRFNNGTSFNLTLLAESCEYGNMSFWIFF
jgi:hypothetical protein